MGKSEVPTVSVPSADEVGEVGTWTLPLTDPVGEVEVTGRFLGHATSRRDAHRNHLGEFARKGESCSACRWFEPRIFRELDGQQRYLLYLTGGSVVPGEATRLRHEWVRTAYEVIEVFTTRRYRDGSEPVRLSGPAARVLAQAATFDSDLETAYIERAVP